MLADLVGVMQNIGRCGDRARLRCANVDRRHINLGHEETLEEDFEGARAQFLRVELEQPLRNVPRKHRENAQTSRLGDTHRGNDEPHVLGVPIWAGLGIARVVHVDSVRGLEMRGLTSRSG